MLTCRICSRARECCYKCGLVDSEYCPICSFILHYHQRKPICQLCMEKHKCSVDNCFNIRLNKCIICQKYIKEIKNCVAHTIIPVGEKCDDQVCMCKPCRERLSCKLCNTIKLNVWKHSCGTFCTDCVPKIVIDLSPCTLAKIDPLISNTNFICNFLYKCRFCMDNKTIHDYQTEEIERYKKLDQMSDFTLT